MTRFDAALATLVDDLLDTVQVPAGPGLPPARSASASLCSPTTSTASFGYVINPVLAQASGEQEGGEACLSIPGVSADRRRAAWHRWSLTGVDLRRQPVTVAGDGELARCLQHETDHLRGELYIDKLAGPEREAVLSALRQRSLTA